MVKFQTDGHGYHPLNDNKKYYCVATLTKEERPTMT